MKEVRNKLSCCTSTVATNSQHVHDLRVIFKDMVSLLEAAEVFKKANAQGEKWEKNNPTKEKMPNTLIKLRGSKPQGPTLLISLKRSNHQLNLFRTTSSKFSPSSPREPTPPRDPAKGKEIAIVKEQVNELVTYQEEGVIIPKMPKLKSFITPEGTLADPLPITKISYTVNSNKEETIKIIRGDNPLNLIVHPNFRLKSLGSSEWLEANKLGLHPPPALATFGMVPKEKKRKRTQFLKEAFVTEDIRVDGMNRNLIPPPGVVPIEGLVIK
uniref:Uncharacterized protein n=1 Tax=Tanacetum cinerariifolium TaxID=118510 RepID=A0A699JVW9_TANCI|nr:hypothetical protein [Tanacetum cinerariifolium]